MEKIITWRAEEYELRHKSVDWYWALWIIAVSLAITAILFSNILLAVLVIVAAFTVSLFAGREPNIFEYSITTTGVKIHTTLYKYVSIQSFWIEELPNRQPRILLRSKKFLMPYIVVPIQDVDPDLIRETLKNYLKEEEQNLSLLHYFFEYLGF